MEKNNEKREIENLEDEDITKYGEFVSSYFAWLSIEKQKLRTQKLEKMTQK